MTLDVGGSKTSKQTSNTLLFFSLEKRMNQQGQYVGELVCRLEANPTQSYKRHSVKVRKSRTEAIQTFQFPRAADQIPLPLQLHPTMPGR